MCWLLHVLVGSPYHMMSLRSKFHEGMYCDALCQRMKCDFMKSRLAGSVAAHNLMYFQK